METTNTFNILLYATCFFELYSPVTIKCWGLLSLCHLYKNEEACDRRPFCTYFIYSKMAQKSYWMPCPCNRAYYLFSTSAQSTSLSSRWLKAVTSGLSFALSVPKILFRSCQIFPECYFWESCLFRPSRANSCWYFFQCKKEFQPLA